MPEPPSVDQRVRKRAAGTCEYCRLPKEVYLLPFQIDHVIARQHAGKFQFGILALACPRCNRNKGPNIAGVDPVSRKIGPLFHPRRDRWHDHFRWRGSRLIGLTQVGRTTIRVLGINQPEALRIRRELIAEGRFPPR